MFASRHAREALNHSALDPCFDIIHGLDSSSTIPISPGAIHRRAGLVV